MDSLRYVYDLFNKRITLVSAVHSLWARDTVYGEVKKLYDIKTLMSLSHWKLEDVMAEHVELRGQV